MKKVKVSFRIEVDNHLTAEEVEEIVCQEIHYTELWDKKFKYISTESEQEFIVELIRAISLHGAGSDYLGTIVGIHEGEDFLSQLKMLNDTFDNEYRNNVIERLKNK